MSDTHHTPHATRRRGKEQRRALPIVLTVFAFVLVAGVAYVGGMFAGGGFNSTIAKLTGQTDIDLSSVQETYHALARNFDGELDTQALIDGANRGLVDAAGDQYTIYMNAEEATAFDNSLTGNIGGGIGVEVGIRNDVPTVVRVLEDNPALQAGIMAGDIIAEVNGEDVLDASLNDVVTMIRGEEGTTVQLTIIRAGESKEFSVTREVINNPSAYGEVRDGIGILTVSRFDDNTGSLARAVARDFVDQGVKGVVLDLRGNGGGYVTAAQAVAGLWLDNKVVVTERTGTKVVDELKTGSNPILDGMPTVVLVNESSASASEIVAGALNDYEVATLVGTTTFGKGSVQKLVNLIDDAVLKVTIARWYTPNGHNISEKGIDPDTVVERTAEDINASRDPQLDAALGALQ